MRAAHAIFAVAVVVGAPERVAHAQTVVYSGAGANASIGGGGARPVWQIGGTYFVFFDNGSEVVYATSVDGTSFSAPQSASGAPANQGFSVARRDASTLGLVWGSSGATGYQLWYREATISGTTLTFGAATQVAADPVETRGYLPTLLYSVIGTPFIAALEFGRGYVGAETGCGNSQRHRMNHYRFDGTAWQWQTYCYDFQTAMTPASIAMARSGANMIPSALVETELNSKIVNEATELGEPWNITPVAKTISGQLSAVQSATTDTDVHYVFPNGTGTIGYARQDGTLTSLSANALDPTPIGNGTFPVLSRPDSATGCYSIAHASGNGIARRRFSGSIASLAPETTLFTTTGPPTNLSAELETGGSPAMVWQVGTTIYFGLPADNPPPTLTATPTSAPADGAAQVAITGGVLRDTCGTPVAAGTLVTVATTAGTITDADADAGAAGTQVAASAGGAVSVTVQAPSAAAIALVSAHLASGGPVATTSVTFGDPPAGCAASPAGTPCVPPDDMCTMGTCDGAGSCLAGLPRDCDDQVECTIDSCDSTLGCVNMPVDCGPTWGQLGVRGGGCACDIPGGRGLAGTALLQLLALCAIVRRRRPAR